MGAYDSSLHSLVAHSLFNVCNGYRHALHRSGRDGGGYCRCTVCEVEIASLDYVVNAFFKCISSAAVRVDIDKSRTDEETRKIGLLVKCKLIRGNGNYLFALVIDISVKNTVGKDYFITFYSLHSIKEASSNRDQDKG